MRKEQKSATRARVLAAARACFSEHGFEGATISKIARTAGVSVGTVHAHFDDKASLLAASLFDEIEAQLNGAWRGAEGPTLVRLEHVLAALYGWYASDVARSRTLLQHTLFLGGAWGERLDGQLAEFGGEVAAAIAEGQATGEIPSPAPAALLAQGFLADYFAVLLRAARHERFDVSAMVAQVIALTRLRCGLRVP